jgi:RNA polymerase sigma factor (TIGR02999 family)
LQQDERSQLVAELYDRLRAMARARMAGQPSAHTLEATSLANEAILRLLKVEANQITDERHFLALAAEAMRQILVDHARGKTALKRGGGVRADELHDDLPASVQLRADPEEVLALNDALGSLESENPEAATIVKMRAFGGIECDEIAALMNVSKRTIERRWRFAMADLRTRMGAGGDDNRDGATGDSADGRATV